MCRDPFSWPQYLFCMVCMVCGGCISFSVSIAVMFRLLRVFATALFCACVISHIVVCADDMHPFFLIRHAVSAGSLIHLPHLPSKSSARAISVPSLKGLFPVHACLWNVSVCQSGGMLALGCNVGSWILSMESCPRGIVWQSTLRTVVCCALAVSGYFPYMIVLCMLSVQPGVILLRQQHVGCMLPYALPCAACLCPPCQWCIA